MSNCLDKVQSMVKPILLSIFTCVINIFKFPLKRWGVVLVHGLFKFNVFFFFLNSLFLKTDFVYNFTRDE